ncbi:hypothetical protein AAMO2058_000579800 [Amorphochlora amoebiformis]
MSTNLPALVENAPRNVSELIMSPSHPMDHHSIFSSENEVINTIMRTSLAEQMSESKRKARGARRQNKKDDSVDPFPDDLILDYHKAAVVCFCEEVRLAGSGAMSFERFVDAMARKLPGDKWKGLYSRQAIKKFFLSAKAAFIQTAMKFRNKDRKKANPMPSNVSAFPRPSRAPFSSQGDGPQTPASDRSVVDLSKKPKPPMRLSQSEFKLKLDKTQSMIAKGTQGIRNPKKRSTLITKLGATDAAIVVQALYSRVPFVELQATVRKAELFKDKTLASLSKNNMSPEEPITCCNVFLDWYTPYRLMFTAFVVSLQLALIAATFHVGTNLIQHCPRQGEYLFSIATSLLLGPVGVVIFTLHELNRARMEAKRRRVEKEALDHQKVEEKSHHRLPKGDTQRKLPKSPPPPPADHFPPGIRFRHGTRFIRSKRGEGQMLRKDLFPWPKKRTRKFHFHIIRGHTRKQAVILVEPTGIDILKDIFDTYVSLSRGDDVEFFSSSFEEYRVSGDSIVLLRLYHLNPIKTLRSQIRQKFSREIYCIVDDKRAIHQRNTMFGAFMDLRKAAVGAYEKTKNMTKTIYSPILKSANDQTDTKHSERRKIDKPPDLDIQIHNSEAQDEGGEERKEEIRENDQKEKGGGGGEFGREGPLKDANSRTQTADERAINTRTATAERERNQQIWYYKNIILAELEYHKLYSNVISPAVLHSEMYQTPWLSPAHVRLMEVKLRKIRKKYPHAEISGIREGLEKAILCLIWFEHIVITVDFEPERFKTAIRGKYRRSPGKVRVRIPWVWSLCPCFTCLECLVGCGGYTCLGEIVLEYWAKRTRWYYWAIACVELILGIAYTTNVIQFTVEVAKGIDQQGNECTDPDDNETAATIISLFWALHFMVFGIGCCLDDLDGFKISFRLCCPFALSSSFYGCWIGEVNVDDTEEKKQQEEILFKCDTDHEFDTDFDAALKNPKYTKAEKKAFQKMKITQDRRLQGRLSKHALEQDILHV